MKNFRVEAVILAVGTLLLGLCIYWGLSAFAAKDRVVSVRGLAEKEVAADHVIWPIIYKTTGNDLQALYDDINSANERISQFLTSNGLTKDDFSVGAPEIEDLRADRYATRESASRDRYNVKTVITVATGKVEAARSLIPRMGELLKQGIAISAGEYGEQVRYEFTNLNKIKPGMIEEATRNARQAALKFAEDSESKLGKIKNAYQGVFSIEDRDAYTPHIKSVRVVTSVDFYLKD